MRCSVSVLPPPEPDSIDTDNTLCHQVTFVWVFVLIHLQHSLWVQLYGIVNQCAIKFYYKLRFNLAKQIHSLKYLSIRIGYDMILGYDIVLYCHKVNFFTIALIWVHNS